MGSRSACPRLQHAYTMRCVFFAYDLYRYTSVQTVGSLLVRVVGTEERERHEWSVQDEGAVHSRLGLVSPRSILINRSLALQLTDSTWGVGATA